VDFARAVFTEQGVYFALFHLEVHVIEHGNAEKRF
jgi:hypothetical protein